MTASENRFAAEGNSRDSRFLLGVQIRKALFVRSAGFAVRGLVQIEGDETEIATMPVVWQNEPAPLTLNKDDFWGPELRSIQRNPKDVS
jgi:hypothetical protein